MPNVSRERWIVALAFGAMLAAGTPAAAASRCDHLLAVLGQQITDVSCVESSDLTTNNPATTPPNDSLPGLPPFAFTPQTDREVISPSAPNRTPITKAVPGISWMRAFPTTRQAKPGSCSGCRYNGTASSSLLAPPGRAASSMGISPGAITWCNRGMPMFRRTRVFSIYI